ncbi:hypothetical protein, partial [Castellaniella defragrans]|uniref:hypothetical protein n=1 Tax=Castellaniella defragrans TaxID=75697 RepID=UPI001B86C5BF
RAADATTGCGPSPRCGVVIIRCKVSSNGQAGSDGRLPLAALLRRWPVALCVRAAGASAP